MLHKTPKRQSKRSGGQPPSDHEGEKEIKRQLSGGRVLIFMSYSKESLKGIDLTRADLIFEGVDHSTLSYEVRVFLNNQDASVNTPTTPSENYADSFTIFGHGGCLGSTGHCVVPQKPRAPTDLRKPHPLKPATVRIVITEALKRLRDVGLTSVMAVPVKVDPSSRQDQPAEELFKFHTVSLQLYEGFDLKHL